MDDIDRAVRAALSDPRNQRPDGLRAGAVATCETCGGRLSLVGVGAEGTSQLDWQWQHRTDGSVPASDHAPIPQNAHNWDED